ncbi:MULTISPECIES: Rrf2 family transcriptional regulator [Thiomicrorhabdus]|uniref:Rrf2 family transcriptional regulator n=1 Tax=Thiomicrorhabdus xiamenensis TaxID=2739063 RepID=A0A7D4SY53_9GAMM|nr:MULTISPECIES: Rrf2 family transcriptional regulator [Thiomicrorhabdus]MBO1923603.1 Rrf2 family transcriptional regulator [Thiomicrorhabdus sp. 6S3-12]QKI88764.1 Rrf2 family transcriptional regulator [Thiomicrorhabdus xiamenensis]
MKITSKGRYAVTAMIDIALNQEKGAVTLSLISERQGISLSYLEQLFAKLKRAQLVSSARGPGGGYRLSRHAREISVSQIIHAVDEHVDARKCKGKQNCHDGDMCLSHELWTELSETIDSFLKGISIQSIIDQKQTNIAEVKFG